MEQIPWGCKIWTLSELCQFRQVQNLDRYTLWHSDSLQPKILKENKMCEYMVCRDVEEPGAARVTSEETLRKQHNLLERRHIIAALGSWHLHLCVGWYKPYTGSLSRERPCASERYTQASWAANSLNRVCSKQTPSLILSLHNSAGLVNNIYKNEGFSSVCRASSLCSCPVDCKPLCLPRHMQEKLVSTIISWACFPSTLPPAFCCSKNPRPYPLFTMDTVARASLVPILTSTSAISLSSSFQGGHPSFSFCCGVRQRSPGSFCFFLTLSCRNESEKQQ